MTRSTERRRSARSSSAGIRNGSGEALMLCLARLIRCAIVASGTRKALAISAVVRPATARSVSAIAEVGVSAGWQHMNMRTRVSSLSAASSGAASALLPAVGSATAASSRPRRAESARMRSVIRREATWTSQPTGLSGVPCAGHCRAASIIASWTASSESPKSPKRRTTAARTRGAASRSRSSVSLARLTFRGSLSTSLVDSEPRTSARSVPSPRAPRSPAGSGRRRGPAPPRPGRRSPAPARATRRR